MIDNLVKTLAAKWAGSKLASWLDGRKTYLAGIGLIGVGLAQIGEENYQGGIEKIFEGVAIISLRAGVKKAGV